MVLEAEVVMEMPTMLLLQELPTLAMARAAVVGDQVRMKTAQRVVLVLL
jgi:hypothetical protein